MKKGKFTINRLATDALLLSFLVVTAWVSVPISAVPVTLQVLGVIIVILMAQDFDSILIVLAYSLMGSLGLPVFNGGSSGFASPTYGFIVGFLVATIVIYGYHMIFERKKDEKLLDIIIKCIIFEFVIYAVGVPWITIYTNSKTFFEWLVYFLPYLGIDTIKVVIAIIVYLKLKPIIEKERELNNSIE